MRKKMGNVHKESCRCLAFVEINSRPSGGIGYTTHSGVDLTQVGFAYWLGLIDKPKLADIAQNIASCQVRSIMAGVKVEEESRIEGKSHKL